jgi:hypothetical protein
MKLGLQNYVVIMQIENSCIKLNNNKINSARRYGNAQNYTILHKVGQLLSEHNFKISNQRHIQNLGQRK